jgi:hypothetical protein
LRRPLLDPRVELEIGLVEAGIRDLEFLGQHLQFLEGDAKLLLGLAAAFDRHLAVLDGRLRRLRRGGARDAQFLREQGRPALQPVAVVIEASIFLQRGFERRLQLFVLVDERFAAIAVPVGRLGFGHRNPCRPTINACEREKTLKCINTAPETG